MNPSICFADCHLSSRREISHQSRQRAQGSWSFYARDDVRQWLRSQLHHRQSANAQAHHRTQNRLYRFQLAKIQNEDGRAGWVIYSCLYSCIDIYLGIVKESSCGRRSFPLRTFTVFYILSILTASSFIALTQVLVEDPDQLESIRQREYDISKERIQLIINSGANVILTTGGIDDLCLKYFVEAGAMAVRRVKKPDLRRIAKATGWYCAICVTVKGSTLEHRYLAHPPRRPVRL